MTALQAFDFGGQRERTAGTHETPPAITPLEARRRRKLKARAYAVCFKHCGALYSLTEERNLADAIMRDLVRGIADVRPHPEPQHTWLDESACVGLMRAPTVEEAA